MRGSPQFGTPRHDDLSPSFTVQPLPHGIQILALLPLSLPQSRYVCRAEVNGGALGSLAAMVVLIATERGAGVKRSVTVSFTADEFPADPSRIVHVQG